MERLRKSKCSFINRNPIQTIQKSHSGFLSNGRRNPLPVSFSEHVMLDPVSSRDQWSSVEKGLRTFLPHMFLRTAYIKWLARYNFFPQNDACLASMLFKPWPNECNIAIQHRSTFLFVLMCEQQSCTRLAVHFDLVKLAHVQQVVYQARATGRLA